MVFNPIKLVKIVGEKQINIQYFLKFESNNFDHVLPKFNLLKGKTLKSVNSQEFSLEVKQIIKKKTLCETT